MPAVLLDVDGTLVDTNYFHTVAWFRAFREAGEEVPMWRIHRLVGMGADKLLADLAGGERPDLEAGWSRHFETFKREIVAFAGARDLIRVLHERDFAVALATSGQEDDVAHVRKVLDAEDWIDVVVNSSEVEASKPAPDIFELALERLGVAASEALVVGDTVWDALAADACGLRCVGVHTGGISGVELRTAGATATYRDVEELLERLDESPIAALKKR
jgi:HAD superfamily hydrolase (TIGR01509 family)